MIDNNEIIQWLYIFLLFVIYGTYPIWAFWLTKFIYKYVLGKKYE